VFGKIGTQHTFGMKASQRAIQEFTKYWYIFTAVAGILISFVWVPETAESQKTKDIVVGSILVLVPVATLARLSLGSVSLSYQQGLIDSFFVSFGISYLLRGLTRE
jgi:hypothetical protein